MGSSLEPGLDESGGVHSRTGWTCVGELDKLLRGDNRHPIRTASQTGANQENERILPQASISRPAQNTLTSRSSPWIYTCPRAASNIPSVTAARSVLLPSS